MRIGCVNFEVFLKIAKTELNLIGILFDGTEFSQFVYLFKKVSDSILFFSEFQVGEEYFLEVVRELLGATISGQEDEEFLCIDVAIDFETVFLLELLLLGFGQFLSKFY